VAARIISADFDRLIPEIERFCIDVQQSRATILGSYERGAMLELRHSEPELSSEISPSQY